ncbi:UNVERIFIED_CONTAM: hypothetical protein FKN15_001431 [Acipenser sinensis]
MRKGHYWLQSEHLDCGAAHLQHPLALRNPLKASPVFESSGLTAVAVASVNDHTIVFLGTATGRLQKLNLLKNLTLGSQKAIRVASRESVHHIMSFDPSDNNYLYLMTSHQMTRVKVAKCDQYKTCNQCLGAVDAYCGWCTLESRCSLQSECTDWKQPHFWISLSEGIDMCPSMTITPSEINLASYLKDSASCPKLIPATLDPIATGTTQDIIFSLANTETLQLFTTENSQQIPVHLRLKEHPDKFIDSPIPMTVEVYNCMSGSTDCSQCWGREDRGHRCVWCENSCRMRSECKAVQESCSAPEIRKIEPLSGPLEGGTLLTIQGRNLGRRFSDITVSIGVEVYNCMSGSTDCSQCWGREDRGHRCVWCENSCRMRSECKAVQESCSAPEIRKNPEVTSIEPNFGAKAGGTKVIISGKNLDVGSRIRVLVNGTKECTSLLLFGCQIKYQLDRRNVGVEDRVQIGTKHTTFVKNPEVTSIEPNFGAKAGGTKVIISGKNLDVGSRIRVLVNGTKECTSLLRTQDTIKCTMPAALLPKAETVQVCVQFEGNPCPSSSNSTMYTYMENPVISEISPKTSHVSCKDPTPTSSTGVGESLGLEF